MDEVEILDDCCSGDDRLTSRPKEEVRGQELAVIGPEIPAEWRNNRKNANYGLIGWQI